VGTYKGTVVDFTGLLKIRMHELGMDATGLAIVVKVSIVTAWNWTQGNTLPRRETLPAVASALGVEEPFLVSLWEGQRDAQDVAYQRNPLHPGDRNEHGLEVVQTGLWAYVQTGWGALDGARHPALRYRCACGSEPVVPVCEFRLLKSCGCLTPGIISAAKRAAGQDLPASVNRWTLLGDFYAFSERMGCHEHVVRVRCECGTEAVISARSYMSGNSKSCGCLKSEATAARNRASAKELPPSSGRLTLIEVIRKDNHRYVRARCSCPAATVVEVSGSNWLSGNSKSCGCLRTESARTRAKLDQEKADEIRRLHASTAHLSQRDPGKWTGRKLAEKFGVSTAHVSQVLKGKLWAG